MTFTRILSTSALCLLPAAGVLAQDNFLSGVNISDNDLVSADLFVTDVSVLDGKVCIGNSCADSETFDNDTLIKLENAIVGMRFEDSSSSGFPDRHWHLLVNDTASISGGGIERFSIQDITEGTIPFTVLGGAPDNAMWIDSFGDVGFGTTLPLADLHVASAGRVSLLLAPTDAGVRSFEIGVDAGGLFTRISTGAEPFEVAQDAAFGSLQVLNSGVRVNAGNFAKDFQVGSDVNDNALFVDGDTARVGVGTSTPEGIFHTKGDGVQLAYYESGDGGPVQVRFRTDSENRRFLATNNADEVKSQIIFKDDEILFTGQTDSGANLWLTIGPSGIVSQGPTCDPGPCDATFDADAFTVPPIKERAAFMWENQYLWGVGPTKPGQPINLTEKMGGVIHELEVAHIYIEQLHNEIAQIKQAETDKDAMHAEQIASLTAKQDREFRQLQARLAILEDAE